MTIEQVRLYKVYYDLIEDDKTDFYYVAGYSPEELGELITEVSQEDYFDHTISLNKVEFVGYAWRVKNDT